MNTEELFDKKIEENFDIKSKRISMLENYGENFQKNEYITNPAIGRDEQIKQLILILLTPDKSAVYRIINSFYHFFSPKTVFYNTSSSVNPERYHSL